MAQRKQGSERKKLKKMKRKLKRKTIGVIGFGAFGEFACRELVETRRLRVFAWNERDSRVLRARAKRVGVRFVNVSEAAACDIVILAVPISKMGECLKRVKPFLKPSVLVVDVCSVKVLPAREMKRLLPRGVALLGTHPLFGPQSAARGIKGKTIALCPVRVSKRRLKKVIRFLRSLGLAPVVCTPREHDAEVARTQALTHFVLRGLQKRGLEKSVFSTSSHAKLAEALDLIKDDSQQLFTDLQRANSFARREREKTLKALIKLHSELSRK
jgi:prephenate dehydrogenase